MKDGQTVIVNNKGKLEVGIIIGRVHAEKRTVYDILLERHSVIASVPNGDSSKDVFIEKSLTAQIDNNIKKHNFTECGMDYKKMFDLDQLPSWRENHIGARSF